MVVRDEIAGAAAMLEGPRRRGDAPERRRGPRRRGRVAEYARSADIFEKRVVVSDQERRDLWYSEARRAFDDIQGRL